MSAGPSPLYKGFTRSHLEWAFGVRFASNEITVPYYGVNGDLYREKLFTAEGRPLRWLGPSRPQVPYGLETLALGGDRVFVTEGESCGWALRACFSTTPAIAAPGASSWQPEWSRLLRRFPTIYLSFDNDEAGIKLLDSVWPTVPWAKRVKLPAGADTRDVLQLLGGRERYEELMADADYMAAVTAYVLRSAKAGNVA